jgi:hypothetical protein
VASRFVFAVIPLLTALALVFDSSSAFAQEKQSQSCEAKCQKLHGTAAKRHQCLVGCGMLKQEKK